MPTGALEIIPTITLIAMLLCLSGQVSHGYLRIMHSNPRVRTVVAVYESAILIHLLLMTMHNCHSVHPGIGVATEPQPDALMPLDMLLWANFAVGAVTAYASLVDMSDSGEPRFARRLPPLETVLVFCCTPPALALFGEMQFIPFIIDAAYFPIRTVAFIVLDTKNDRKIVSPLSIAESLRRLPEGILYADQTGHVFIANSIMSQCLASLGIASSSTTVSDIWSQLVEKAQSGFEVHVPYEYMHESANVAVLRIGENETRLFSLEDVDLDAKTHNRDEFSSTTSATISTAAIKALGDKPETRIIAYDVTEQVRILEEIEQTNGSLVILKQELETSIGNVREAAENEALLRMRGRVHDIIGQRVSILHRTLESGEITREKIEQLKPLLNSILEDLPADAQINPEDEISATIDAFALTDLEIRVEGELPENPRRAKIFADVIRESATNAVRHGNANRLEAVIGNDFIEISDNGLPTSATNHEGVGLSNARRIVEAEGGTFTVTNEPFTIRIDFREGAWRASGGVALSHCAGPRSCAKSSRHDATSPDTRRARRAP